MYCAISDYAFITPTMTTRPLCRHSSGIDAWSNATHAFNSTSWILSLNGDDRKQIVTRINSTRLRETKKFIEVSIEIIQSTKIRRNNISYAWPTNYIRLASYVSASRRNPRSRYTERTIHPISRIYVRMYVHSVTISSELFITSS